MPRPKRNGWNCKAGVALIFVKPIGRRASSFAMHTPAQVEETLRNNELVMSDGLSDRRKQQLKRLHNMNCKGGPQQKQQRRRPQRQQQCCHAGPYKD